MNTIQLINYITASGKEPLERWLNDLDTYERALIRKRINRLRLGLFTSCKPIEGKISELWELVIDDGPGYRVYFGKQGKDILIMLLGGHKGTQRRDIEKAKRYWADYKENI